MDNTTFLDIDESLRMKNLLLPDEERDALDNKLDEWKKKIEEETAARSFIFVQPVPGICVKTKTICGKKIFVNICISDNIRGPEDISDNELYKILNDDETDYVVPISMGIGGERMEMDNSNVPCSTFDAMINATYFKKCREKNHFMAFTILAILNGLADRYNKEIDCDNFIVLKNRTVIGKLQQHKILNREIQDMQDVKKPGHKLLIEVIPQSKKSIDKDINLQNIDKLETGYIVLKRPLDNPVESLIVLFDMPKTISIDDVVVLVNPDRINVTDEKAYCTHDILLPYTVKKDSAKAYMDYNLRILRVDVLVQ